MTDNEIVPNRFIDPYTREIMNDPVKMEDGYTYERNTIINYMNQNSNRSPLTGQVMSRTMEPNKDLKDDIIKYNENKSPKKINLIVENYDGRKFMLNLFENDKVEEIKKMLSLRTNTKVGFIKLTFNGKFLAKDCEKLKNLNMKDNSLIKVVDTGSHGG